MPEPLEQRASVFIQRHGFGAFIACVMLIEVLGLNPYSPLRQITAMEQRLSEHERSVQQTNTTLRSIESLVREQTRIQSESALITCLRQSRTDAQREECAKKFGSLRP